MTQANRDATSASRMPAQITTVCHSPGPVVIAPARMPRRLRPMNRNTAFSRRNWMVRQFSRSATRASAEATHGALKPR